MSLGKRITELRKQKRLSQAALGKIVGTSGDIIGRYERDEVKPSIEVVIKIADTLKVSIDFLVGKADVLIDQDLLSKVIEVQKLDLEDQSYILKAFDAMLRDAKTRKAYAS